MGLGKPLMRRSILPRVLRTTAFRYTFAFFIAFIVLIGGLGYYVFKATQDTTLNRFDTELISELNYLAQRNAQFGNDGTAGLNAVVNEVARLKVVQKDALYMVLIGFEGRPFLELTSDLKQLPINALSAEGMFHFDYKSKIVNNETGETEVVIRPAVGRIANFLYTAVDGTKVRAVILTARDVNELSEIRNVALTNAFRVGIVSLIAALLFGALYSRVFLRRVDRIGQTVRAISRGDLTKRISLTGTNDEFDNLSENINAMLDQIEQLMTGMRQVSDNIAHDLRSPLTRIKARLDAALNQASTDKQVVIDQTALDVERLLATFNALLSITRIESGEGGGTKVPVNISDVAKEMLEFYDPAADDAGFVLIGRVDDVPEILGSRELISQAIANLLDNALKYAKRDEDDPVTPVIELTVSSREEGGVLLTVMDNGPGVSEVDYDRIQQRFVRLERSRSTTGNGLGLSLVAAIASRHRAILSIGRGLPHAPEKKALMRPDAYGLGVRLSFPPHDHPSAKTSKRAQALVVERNISGSQS